LSAIGSFTRTVATFATSRESYQIDATLAYQPFIDDRTFQLLTGAFLEGPCWIISMDTLTNALAHPDVDVPEGDITVTATSQSIVMTLPLNGEFAFIQLHVTLAREFVAMTKSTPFATWGDGRAFAGTIDEGEMPCFV